MGRGELYLILAVAIVAEVVGTTALARSEAMTRFVPTVTALGCYGIAFWLLSLALRTLPTGVVYGIWSGLGIVLVAAVAWIWQGQRLDAPAVLGLGLIVAGVMVVNLFSTSVGH